MQRQGVWMPARMLVNIDLPYSHPWPIHCFFTDRYDPGEGETWGNFISQFKAHFSFLLRCGVVTEFIIRQSWCYDRQRPASQCQSRYVIQSHCLSALNCLVLKPLLFD